MKALYLETSAIVAWLFGEPSAAAVAKAVDGAEAVATSVLTFVEVERAIVRAVARQVVNEVEAQRLRGLLAGQRSKWIAMSLTENVLSRAGRAFPVEPIRTLDAIHLATALAFTEAFPDLTLLALDRRVMDNATSLGLV